MHKFKTLMSAFMAAALIACISLFAVADGDDGVDFVSGSVVAAPSVMAKSVVLMDTATRSVLFEQNSNEAVSISHLTKLMTLLLTAEAIDKGELTLETMLTTSASANSMGDPQIWLNVGEQISVDELIKAITIGNANDAACVLAQSIGGTTEEFVSLMNQRASQLGMTNTIFTNPTGIDDDTQYSTAFDVALLSCEVLKHENLIPYMTTWMLDVRNGSTNLVNSNRLVRTYKGITGLKAGSSQKAGSCIATSAHRNNFGVVCVILGSENPDVRFDDAKTLLDYAFSAYEMFIPEIDAEKLKPISVKSGQSLNVKIEMASAPGLVIPKGTSAGIETVITVEECVEAPVEKGREFGKICFYRGEELITETRIIASEEIDRISVGFSFKKLLDYLLKF